MSPQVLILRVKDTGQENMKVASWSKKKKSKQVRKMLTVTCSEMEQRINLCRMEYYSVLTLSCRAPGSRYFFLSKDGFRCNADCTLNDTEYQSEAENLLLVFQSSFAIVGGLVPGAPPPCIPKSKDAQMPYIKQQQSTINTAL